VAVAFVTPAAQFGAGVGHAIGGKIKGNQAEVDFGYTLMAQGGMGLTLEIGLTFAAGPSASKVGDGLGLLKTGLGKALQKVGLRTVGCFVAGTSVRFAGSDVPIEDVERGDRVLAAASTDAGWEAPETVEIAPTSKKATWLRRACERVKRAARTMALPTAILTACDVGAVPEADVVVEVYDARTGTWFEDEARDVDVGEELMFDGHLFRVDDSGLVDLGSVSAEALVEADAAVRDVAVVAEPDRDSWVLVLADEDGDVGHARLADIEPGDRFAFQGRVYEAFGDDRVDSVMETGLVVSRVAQTFVRQSDTVIDAEIQYDDGTVEVITGTPEHPFYVPALGDSVALG